MVRCDKQCLKYGSITTNLGSDKQNVGSDKSLSVQYIMVDHKINISEKLLTSECIIMDS